MATSEILNLYGLKSDISCCVCVWGEGEGDSSALCVCVCVGVCVGVTHVSVYGDGWRHISIGCWECEGSLANGSDIVLGIKEHASAIITDDLPYFKIHTCAHCEKIIN